MGCLKPLKHAMKEPGGIQIPLLSYPSQSQSKHFAPLGTPHHNELTDVRSTDCGIKPLRQWVKQLFYELNSPFNELWGLPRKRPCLTVDYLGLLQ